MSLSTYASSSWPINTLFLPCLLMGFTTFLVGLLPLAVPLSASSLRILEVLGSGLLVGAATTVVIPEGVAALFRGECEKSTASVGSVVWQAGRAYEEHKKHGEGTPKYDAQTKVGMALIAGYLIMFCIDQFTSPGPHAGPAAPITPPPQRSSQRPESWRLSRASTTSSPLDAPAARKTAHAAHGSGDSSSSSPDSLPADYGSHVSSPGAGVTDAFLPSPDASRRADEQREHASTGVARARGSRRAFTATAGLVIHAAADGIAMGASAGSGDEGLRIIVWVAIMIHKAPAAFGLCTLLMSQRLARSDVRKAIAVFALSTPIGAILTYFILSISLGMDNDGTGLDSSHIGLALTFSGGTFLFVAMHAVQHATSSHSEGSHHAEGAAAEVGSAHEHDDAHGHAHGDVNEAKLLGRTGRVAILLLGAMLPRMLQGLVGHGH